MPWTADTARHMVTAVNANLITSSEYDKIRMVLDTNRTQATEDNGAMAAAADDKAQAIVAPPVFALGASSLAKLDGVKMELVACVRLAITLSKQDFTVYEGLRSLAQQQINVRKGVSQTLDSKHIRQADGFGHAVDLVPWIDGHPVWDWNGCYDIARAMDEAATRLGYPQHIRWGGAWDVTLADMAGDSQAYAKAVQLYKDRHKGSDFLDGPHFEWKP